MASVIRSTMPKKKKHPAEMTDEEALKHIFHPKIVRAVKKHLRGQEQDRERNVEPKSQDKA
jgi:hypothetical protein